MHFRQCTVLCSQRNRLSYLQNFLYFGCIYLRYWQINFTHNSFSLYFSLFLFICIQSQMFHLCVIIGTWEDEEDQCGVEWCDQWLPLEAPLSLDHRECSCYYFIFLGLVRVCFLKFAADRGLLLVYSGLALGVCLSTPWIVKPCILLHLSLPLLYSKYTCRDICSFFSND